MGILYSVSLEAKLWYKKAAGQGNAKGQFNLGYMYEHGQGFDQSYPKAKEWYKKAAEQGDLLARHNLNSLLNREPALAEMNEGGGSGGVAENGNAGGRDMKKQKLSSQEDEL